MIELIAAAGLLYIVYRATKSSPTPPPGPSADEPQTPPNNPAPSEEYKPGSLPDIRDKFTPAAKKMPSKTHSITRFPTGEKFGVGGYNTENDPNIPSQFGGDGMIEQHGAQIVAGHHSKTPDQPVTHAIK